MKGIYGRSVNKSGWYWKVILLGEEVASGLVRNRKEIQEVINSQPMVRWYKDTEIE